MSQQVLVAPMRITPHCAAMDWLGVNWRLFKVMWAKVPHDLKIRAYAYNSNRNLNLQHYVNNGYQGQGDDKNLAQRPQKTGVFKQQRCKLANTLACTKPDRLVHRLDGQRQGIVRNHKRRTVLLDQQWFELDAAQLLVPNDCKCFNS